MQTTSYEATHYVAMQPLNYVGRFTVIHKSGITRFTILDLAIKFFNELEEEATVWDVTDNYVLLKFRAEPVK